MTRIVLLSRLLNRVVRQLRVFCRCLVLIELATSKFKVAEIELFSNDLCSILNVLILLTQFGESVLFIGVSLQTAIAFFTLFVNDLNIRLSSHGMVLLQ